MIAVILPTRGCVLTQTLKALHENMRGMDWKLFLSDTLPIPDCENVLVDQALLENPTHILFVEEDTVIPEGGVQRMLDINQSIVCIDYSVEGWSCTAKDKKTDEVLWCGLGCTLVKAGVFEVLEKPYFRTDRALLLNDWPEEKWIEVPPEKAYGGQDIYFCMSARAKGFIITKVPGECKHLRLVSLGLKEINNGLHNIKERDGITKPQYI